MFIKTISFVLPEKKLTLGRRGLSTKVHFEDESFISYYIANSADSPSSLAISAVSSALCRAKVKKSNCKMVIYAHSLLKDYEAWSLSASICESANLKNASFLDIYQGCNGGICALELTDRMSSWCKKGDFAIIATSTLLPKTIGNHLVIDRGGVMSDGATALILSNETGRYKMLSIDLKYDSSCNEFIKLPYGGTNLARERVRIGEWELLKIKEEFTKGDGEEKIIKAFRKIRIGSILSALKKARISINDISFVVVPNYCRLYNTDVISLFKHLSPSKFSIDAGMEVSHVGASDIFINLVNMDRRIHKGDLVAIMQDGAGISAGCAILKKC